MEIANGTHVMVTGKVAGNSGTCEGEWHGTVIGINGGWMTIEPDAAVGSAVKVRNSKVTVVEEPEAPVVEEPATGPVVKLCGCGCGQLAAGKREFRQGHDQRHKGNLIRAFLGGSEGAQAELLRRGWRSVDQLASLAAKNVKRENQCRRCGTPLSDPISLAIGYGPICSALLGVERPEPQEKEVEEAE